MKTSLNGARLGAGSLSFLEFVDLAARHGFDGVDFSISAAMRAMQEADGAELIGHYFHERSVAPAAFGLEVEWRRDENTYQQDMAKLEDQARFAQQLGATRCVTWMPPSVGNAEDWDRIVVRRFSEIAAVLERFDVRLGLEWVGPHHLRAGAENAMGDEAWIYTLPATLELIDRIGVPTVGLLVDSYHCYTTGVTESDIAALGDERIVHVHINDAPIGVGPTGARDGERLLPGLGEIDLPAFLRGLNAAGYQGYVAAEILAPHDLADNPETAAERVRESLRTVGV